MPKTLRVVLAVVLGFVVGSAINTGIVMFSGKLIPPPSGADTTTMEGLKASLHLFEPRHFVFPFLAHALGTLVGAFVAALVIPSKSPLAAFWVGALFLLGGIASAFMLPGPAWFTATDLLLAYGPTAWLGHALAVRFFKRTASGA